MRSWVLMAGGTLTAAAALLHVAVIVGGAGWYRFFGAGERMARMAERGSPLPALVTAGIAALLAVWSLYAFSGAGIIRPLPFTRPALAAIAAVFLARGLLAIPLVLGVDDPYLRQLRDRMGFMLATSLVCVGVGLCYALGALQTEGTKM